ncbi:AAA family ATPase [Ruminococcus sp.]|uniref:AAA family ATPase n=1 Tax=Ruminococcus sp. TaxID=41978 RepID=UPI003AF18DA4
MSFKYKYESGLKKGERQYDRYYDLKTEKKVTAKYIKSYQYQGNPYIEALPKGRSIEEVLCFYNRVIDVPNEEELSSMDEYERCDTVEALDDFRIALPFHAMVELEFHRALVRSYKKREIMEDPDVNLKYTMENKDMVSHNCIVSRNFSDPALGFTLLGTSGCGKSTGINMLLENYPQVIIHEPDTWQRTVQIVYLHIHCPQNSNFNLLYRTIGRAFDRALGNLNPIYETLLTAGRDLGTKYATLRNLVERFAVGMIILDEIELLDTKSTKETSFEMFMQLSNETGVAVSVIGTMDAYTDIFSKRRTARRTGVLIEAAKYCTKKKQFEKIVNNLTMFQWRPDPVYYDDALVNALFEATDGVISDLIEIYKQIQKDYLRTKRENVTPDYIVSIADKYYKGLREISLMEKNPIRRNDTLTEEEIRRLNSFNENVEQQELEQRYDELMSNPTFKTYELLQENVIRSIQEQTKDYSRTKIETAFVAAMEGENVVEVRLVDIVTKTLLKLQATKQRVKALPKADIEKSRAELLENNRKEKVSKHTI